MLTEVKQGAHELSRAHLPLVAITVLFWDALLTLADEERYVWKKFPFFLKVAWMFNRYGTGLALTLFIWSTIPSHYHSTPSCQYGVYIGACLFCLGDSIGNALTVYRVFVLWDRSAAVLRRLLAGAVVALIAEVTFIILIFLKGTYRGYFDRDLDACRVHMSTSYYLSGLFISQALFDIFATCLVIFNAMDIPRTPDDRLWRKLSLDGTPLLLVTFLLRIADVVLSTLHSTSLRLIGMTFIAGIIAVLNARIVLWICRVYDKKSEGVLYEESGGMMYGRESPHTFYPLMTL
ncbi:hypothetical protein BS17DRAFT_777985 [Gyrodon lividus]|nr:hypothetical protein BS17DRAFT_777985 [Gyrodon lividus]